VATTFVQVRQLLALLDTETDVAQAFDAWCEANMLPWVLVDIIGAARRTEAVPIN
jgi:hypothetical protein